MDRVIALRPPRIAMGLVLVAIAAHSIFVLPVHPGQPHAGALLGTSGFFLMLRAWWLFRRAGTAVCPTAVSSALVTRDVFAVTRNPMYLGIITMLAGLAVTVGTLAFHAAWMVFALIMDRCFCPYEEAKAAREFGDAYRAYARRVRRWL